MIFVILGSQKFQFNRVLQYLDKLIEEGSINEDVFAQIGHSSYLPKLYNFERFLDRADFLKKIEEAEIIVTHSGTGAIVSSLKACKKVITMPRLKEYDEHVDNHQLQIAQMFEDKKYLLVVKNIVELREAISQVMEIEFEYFISNNDLYLSVIKDFIEK